MARWSFRNSSGKFISKVEYQRREAMSSFGDDFGSSVGRTESYLWDGTFGGEFRDPVAQTLFHEAYFVRDSSFSPEELSAIRDNLRDYLHDTYGFDFDEHFDWEVWRSAYAGTE